MSIVTMSELLKDAQQRGYAVGGFDTWNLESVRAVVEAAVDMRSPAIILTGPYGLGMNYESLKYYGAMARVAAGNSNVPIAILLNEVPTIDHIVQGIRCGFTGVMMDTSHMPFEKNVELTKRVVEIAHAAGVSVEAQADIIPFEEDLGSGGKKGSSFGTDPKIAEEFVRQTGVDALSVIAGNVHAMPEGKVNIDLERLKKVKERVDVPLVLHGGTGISDKSLKGAVKLGVCKFNFGSALRTAFLKGMEMATKKGPGKGSVEEYVFVEQVLSSGKERMKKVVKEKMELCMSCGRV
jgi:tagatose 1,6-diphosphate aldolase GatY/KbaY